MKASITHTIKTITTDRSFLIALIAMSLVSLIFTVYVIANLRSSELQVVTHYSAFGSTNFYRDKWYYLVGFAAVGIINAVFYSALACKIYMHKGRELAIPFAWLGVVTIVFASAVVYQVLKVASLS